MRVIFDNKNSLIIIDDSGIETIVPVFDIENVDNLAFLFDGW